MRNGDGGAKPEITYVAIIFSSDAIYCGLCLKKLGMGQA